MTDALGNQLIDPIIISDTGFDFAGLQTPGAQVGEPPTAVLLGLGVAAVGIGRVRRKRT